MAYVPQFDPKRDYPILPQAVERRSTVFIGTTTVISGESPIITEINLDGPLFIRAKYPGRHGNFLTVESSLSSTLTLTFTATLEIPKVDRIKLSPGTSVEIIGAVAAKQPARLITVGFYTNTSAQVIDELLGVIGTFTVGSYFISSSVCFGLKNLSMTTTGTDTITFLAGYPQETYTYAASSAGSSNHLNISTISQDINSKSMLITLVDPPGHLSDIRDPRTPVDVAYPNFKFPSNFKAKLSNGDGPPETPVGIKTGPSRTVILISHSELENGRLSRVGKVLEWKGTSAADGSWKKIDRNFQDWEESD